MLEHVTYVFSARSQQFEVNRKQRHLFFCLTLDVNTREGSADPVHLLFNSQVSDQVNNLGKPFVFGFVFINM